MPMQCLETLQSILFVNANAMENHAEHSASKVLENASVMLLNSSPMLRNTSGMPSNASTMSNLAKDLQTNW